LRRYIAEPDQDFSWRFPAHHVLTPTITAILRQHAPGAVRVGLETGQLSNWLTLNPEARLIVELDRRFVLRAAGFFGGKASAPPKQVR
jgi:hypothetical protein